MLSVITPNVVMPSVVMPSDVVPSVVMPSVVAPLDLPHLQCLLLRVHLDLLLLLGHQQHLVLLHQLPDERVLPHDFSPEDSVQTRNVLVLHVAAHQLPHHGLVTLRHLLQKNLISVSCGLRYKHITIEYDASSREY